MPGFVERCFRKHLAVTCDASPEFLYNLHSQSISVSEVGPREVPNWGTSSFFPADCGYRNFSPFISCLIVLQRSWINIFISWFYLPVVNTLLLFSERLTKFSRQDKEEHSHACWIGKLQVYLTILGMHEDLENNHFVLNRTTVLKRNFMLWSKRVWIILKICKNKNSAAPWID